ncbi:MAG: LysR family transcriptional regulator [Pseudomonadota bacterium]
MNYTLKHLQALLGVARTGSFTAAAEKLHVTRPSLSVLIKELEEKLGFAVFTRTTRRLVLTEEGKAFLPLAERVMAEYQASVWAARHMFKRGKSVLKIACSQLMACALLPDAIVRFNAREAQIDIQIIDVSNDEVIDAVVSGQADIGIGPERYVPDTVSASILFSSPLGCICSSEHPFAKSKRVTWKDLTEQTIISSDKAGWLMLMRDLDYTTRFESSIEVRHFMTGLALISRNIGVMVSTGFVAPLLSPQDLCLVPLVAPVIERRTVLYTRAGVQRSAEVKAFVELVKEMRPRSEKPAKPTA